jgi:3-oxoacyl-[acyl-carrier protein] reductase
MSDLKGKVAIVTGASKGIGAAIAEKLAANGAAVVVNYSRSASEAEALVKRIRNGGSRAIAVQADLSRPAEAEKLFKRALEEFGRVDVLVNNAGTYEFLPLSGIQEEHYNRMFDLNVKGLLFASQQAAAAFADSGGSIINISSVVSVSPKANASVYSATKAAVDAITKSLAAELGPRKILVNSILPGVTETEGLDASPASENFRNYALSQTPLGRIGQPKDIAGVVAFLASDDAKWITGQLISVSGGLQ